MIEAGLTTAREGKVATPNTPVEASALRPECPLLSATVEPATGVVRVLRVACQFPVCSGAKLRNYAPTIAQDLGLPSCRSVAD